MEINYFGRSCFKIGGKNLSILIDPFDPDSVGIKMQKVETDVLLVSHSHPDHSFTGNIKGEYLLLDSPGEYEVKGVNINGILSFHDEAKGSERGRNTIFVIEIENLKLCHLGDLGAELDSGQLEAIDGVDVLFIPVGGKYTIDPKTAVKVISDIEPKIVIPMHYADGKDNDLAPLDKFLTEIGEEAEVVDRLKISAKEIGDEMKVVVLKH